MANDLKPCPFVIVPASPAGFPCGAVAYALTEEYGLVEIGHIERVDDGFNAYKSYHCKQLQTRLGFQDAFDWLRCVLQNSGFTYVAREDSNAR